MDPFEAQTRTARYGVYLSLSKPQVDLLDALRRQLGMTQKAAIVAALELLAQTKQITVPDDDVEVAS